MNQETVKDVEHQEGCTENYSGNEYKKELTSEDKSVLSAYPEGTMIYSTIGLGLGGGTEVFIGDGLHVQPFSYLGDYNINHYTKEKPNE